MGATESKTSNSKNKSNVFNVNSPNSFDAFIRNVFENYSKIPRANLKESNANKYLKMLGEIKLLGLIEYMTKLRDVKERKQTQLRDLYVRRQIEVANGINNTGLREKIQRVKKQLDELIAKQAIFNEFFKDQYSQFNQYLNTAAMYLSRLEEPSANNYAKYRIQKGANLAKKRKNAKMRIQKVKNGPVTANNIKKVNM